MRVHKRPAAKQDLIDIAAFIRNPEFSLTFLGRAEECFRKLAEMPRPAGKCDFVLGPLTGIRSLPVPGFRNYLIFYRIQGDQLEIIRVLHGARDLELALEEGAGPEDSSS